MKLAMANSKTLFTQLKSKITIDENASEIDSILYLLFDKKLGVTRTDLMVDKKVDNTFNFDEIIERINNYEPIQYILGEADFFGRSYLVNKHVLIPRPETELLVEVAINCLKGSSTTGTIVDIGTGSGCIAITLAKELPTKKIIGIDISQDAIEIATENAKNLNAEISFICNDILANKLPIKNVECIISNPPYIAQSEAQRMNKNVTSYEPHIALFVTDKDPLIFYRRILEVAYVSLAPNGFLIVEINERFGNEVATLFKQHNFADVQVLKDLDGKDRIVLGKMRKNVLFSIAVTPAT
jgi:release factor glutamine methyltransferase